MWSRPLLVWVCSLIPFLLPTMATASLRCEDVFAAAKEASPPILPSEGEDDLQKPQNRKWVSRQNGQATFDLSDIVQSINAHFSVQEQKNLVMSVYRNGFELPERYPWGPQTLTLQEPPFGQLDYYLFVKKVTAGREEVVLISEMSMRETHDSQNLDAVSFESYLDKNRKFGVKLNPWLEGYGLKSDLTSRAIEKGYNKIVWVLRPEASTKLSKFVHSATQGVSVVLRMDERGTPIQARVTDRATGKSMTADPKNFFFKVDAAFNGNAFFWDDMFVSLATISHHPWLAKSTIEFWLSVQKMNKGVVPREVRKENLLSLWFDKIIRPGQAPTDNLQYTNPYLIHWVAEKLFAADPSAENLGLMKQVVSSMADYTQWMEKNRAVFDDNHEFIGFTANALGSGLDNSRGSRGNDHSPESYKSGWVDPLAQQISMYKSMARWKRALGEDKTARGAQDLNVIDGKIASLEHLLNTKYWNQEQGFYFDLIPDGRGGVKQDTNYYSIAGFWPLFSMSASPEQLQRIIETQLTPDHFGAKFPFPANSLHSLKLKAEEDGYWNRDARWPSMATVAIEGLRLSGRPDLAFTMATQFLRGMTEANSETVAEMYGAGNKLNVLESKGRVGQHEGHTTRLDFAGWGKVPPVYLMLENIIGLEPQVDGKLVWNVYAPMQIGDTLEVNNYIYRDQLIKKLVLKKVAEDHFVVTSDVALPTLQVQSFRDPQGRLLQTPRSVRLN